MVRLLPLRKTKKRPVDAEDFIRKVQIALATKDEFSWRSTRASIQNILDI